jgi:hypothetical protein
VKSVGGFKVRGIEAKRNEFADASQITKPQPFHPFTVNPFHPLTNPHPFPLTLETVP